MSNKLGISQAPHIASNRTTRGIMLDVLIALVPTSIAGIVIFGLRSIAVIAACVYRRSSRNFFLTSRQKKQIQ